MLLPEGAGVNWSGLLKPFNLFVSDWEQKNEQAAASYLGYAPLSVRHAQWIIVGGVAAVKRPWGSSSRHSSSRNTECNTKSAKFLMNNACRLCEMTINPCTGPRLQGERLIASTQIRRKVNSVSDIANRPKIRCAVCPDIDEVVECFLLAACNWITAALSSSIIPHRRRKGVYHSISHRAKAISAAENEFASTHTHSRQDKLLSTLSRTSLSIRMIVKRGEKQRRSHHTSFSS
jgi:hypothetical protein